MTSSGRKSGAKAAILTIRVHPSSRQAKIEKLGPLDYKIHVMAPPEKGRANDEVVEALASFLDVPASRIRIVRGEKSRIKLVAVDIGAGS
jgi:uncharacterized protein YggU (UPF0235/DUF167 family)